MNVHWFSVGLVLLGLASAFMLGRLRLTTGVASTFLMHMAMAVLVTMLLIGGLVPLIYRVCAALGYTAEHCVPTNDQTVWALTYPILAFPLYVFAMYLGRKSRKD